ncbi:MAG: universal stress protein [Nitrospira sp.]|nr:universal stress protein [Nitrospira sp.]
MKTAAHPKRTILVATDFSKPVKLVVPYAFKLALALNLRLTILHVVKAPPESEQWSPAARRSLHSLKTKALLELGRIIRLANENGLMADHKLLVGIPEDCILEVAHRPHIAFIVMGTHGKTGWDRLRLGSVAESTLRQAPCPVLTVRASVPAHTLGNPRRLSIARFLAATDFSASSMAALRTAVELAKRLNARMLLVHATEPSGSLQSDPLRIDELSQKRYAHQFQKIISASRGDEVITEKIVITGDPVKVILDQAKHQNTDLIVVGTQGRRGMKRLMLGSVAEAVVRRAACPVFTVRTQVRNPLDVTTGTRRSPPRSSTG